MNLITDRLETIKLNQILKNYKKEEFWKKNWLIFKCKDFNITWHITSIDTIDNYIQSECVLTYLGRKKRWKRWSYNYCRSCASIPLNNIEYTNIHFQKNILGSSILTIDYLERDIANESYDYKEAEKLEYEEQEKLKQIAIDFLDKENVTNEDIREAYIDSFVDKNSNFYFCLSVLDSSPRKYYPTARLLLYSWFNDKEKFKEESKIVNSNKNKNKHKIIYEIWKARKELENPEYIESMTDKLEKI